MKPVAGSVFLSVWKDLQVDRVELKNVAYLQTPLLSFIPAPEQEGVEVE